MSTTTSVSASLRRKIELLLPSLNAAGAAVMRGDGTRERYPEYLFVLHCIVRATVPVMETALGAAQQLAADDPIASELVTYLREHIPEEMGHDEWLLEDLAALGCEREAVLQRPPPASVATLVGAQYYWIFHHHPVCLLGHIAVMEGYPPTAEQIDALSQRTGYPPSAFRTLHRHADLDAHHRDEFDELVDRLPLTDEQEALIGMSALHTVGAAATVMREVSHT